MPSLLEALGASAGYGEIQVLDQVDVAIPAASITAIIGSNGAGKSTLMRSLAGLLRLRSGRIRFDGADVTGRFAHQRVDDGIALVPEGRLVFADFTVAETLRIGAYLPRARKGWQARVDQMYELFPRLKERHAQQAGTLSGGEQQMLAVSRALMLRPRLMLLDEPSFGLAPLIVREIFDALERLNREEGLTVLVVEQDAAVALRACREACVLEVGRVVVSGPSEELAENESVRKAYLGY